MQAPENSVSGRAPGGRIAAGGPILNALPRNPYAAASQALVALEDTVVLGTMMLAVDEVDGLVSGAVHTTANTVRPALQLIRTALVPTTAKLLIWAAISCSSCDHRWARPRCKASRG